ncbi:MAG: hypothetical protein PHH11_01405 [Methylomonas sp.]|nr:hypothetical protein [Methylomonas sp.]
MTKIQDSHFALPQAARFGNCSLRCPTSYIPAVEGAIQGGTSMTKWQDSHFALPQAAHKGAVQGGTA